MRCSRVRRPANPGLDLVHDLTFYICELPYVGFVDRFRTPGTPSTANIEDNIAW